MALRLIQVGLGQHGIWVGKEHILSSEEFTYSGLVDIDSKRFQSASNALQVSIDLCYTDYRDAFSNVDADAVYIAAASPFHYEICKSALEHGLHVLVEKPFVTDLCQAQELVNLAKQKQLNIMVDQNYRWNGNVLTLKHAIDSKMFGEVMFVDAKFFLFHEGKIYQHQMKDYMLLEMAVHHIDMMRFLFDSNVQSVKGNTWNVQGSEYVGDPNVRAVYEMDCGFPVFYLGSLLAHGLRTPWEGSWRIQCEKGSIHLDDLGSGYGVYLVNEREEMTKADVIHINQEGLFGVLSEFASSILHHRQPATSAEDNLQTLAALIATSVSSTENAGVQLGHLLTVAGGVHS